MNTMRELPIGIQDFEKLRQENCVYVDKTQYVYLLKIHTDKGIVISKIVKE